MKYTKKQIESAFLKWVTDERLIPTNFMSDDEVLSYDASEMAKTKTNVLISYINK